MSVLDFSLKVTKYSMFSPFLVSYPRDEMSHFLTRVSDNLVEEYRSSTLHEYYEYLSSHG